MRGTDKVTKLEGMTFTRMALCKTPADPTAKFVLVKSVDDAENADAVPADSLTPEMATFIEKAIAIAIEKSPTLAAYGDAIKLDTSDPNGKPELKQCVSELVKECNASKTTPKKVKEKVADIAKFLGTEGPDITDDGTPSQFADAISAMNSVTNAMTQMMTQMVAAQQQPAAAPTKKSEDEAPVEEVVVPVVEKPQIPAAVVKAHSETMSAAKAMINELMKEFGKEPKFK